MKSIAHLLQRACKALSMIPSEAILPLVEYSGNDALLKSVNFSEMEEIGLELVIRYGILLRYDFARFKGLLKLCIFRNNIFVHSYQ